MRIVGTLSDPMARSMANVSFCIRTTTSSRSGVVIPDNVDEVVIRGHDKVHELGGKEMTLKLAR